MPTNQHSELDSKYVRNQRRVEAQMSPLENSEYDPGSSHEDGAADDDCESRQSTQTVAGRPADKRALKL